MNTDNGTSHSTQHHSSVPDSTICEQLRALIPAYSIGATDPTETAFVEANLVRCPEVALELSDYLILADEFLYVAAPERQPVEVIRPRTVATAYVSEPRLVLRASPAVITTTPKNNRASWGIALAAVLALVLFGGVNAFWFNQVTQLEQAQRILQIKLEEAEVVQVPVSSGVVHHRDLLPNIETTVSHEAHATLIWNTGREVGSLYVTGLPELASDKRYQLWVVREGHSLSLGLFNVDNDGTGTLVFEAAEPIEGFEHIGISTEPADGSPMPTTPHLVLGTI